MEASYILQLVRLVLMMQITKQSEKHFVFSRSAAFRYSIISVTHNEGVVGCSR